MRPNCANCLRSLPADWRPVLLIDRRSGESVSALLCFRCLRKPDGAWRLQWASNEQDFARGRER